MKDVDISQIKLSHSTSKETAMIYLDKILEYKESCNSFGKGRKTHLAIQFVLANQILLLSHLKLLPEKEKKIPGCN